MNRISMKNGSKLDKRTTMLISDLIMRFFERKQGKKEDGMEMNKGSYLHNELNDVRLEKQWKP